MVPPPAVHLVQPGRAVARFDQGQQLLQGEFQVADDRHVGLQDLADLGRVDVDVHDLGARPELVLLAHGPVVEARAQADDAVGVAHGEIRVGQAVHAQHPERQRMGLGERPHAVQRADDGDAAAGGELQQLFGGAGNIDAVAGHDDRALGRVDDLGRLADHPGVADLGGPVAAQVDLVGRGFGGGFQEDVLGNVHVDRARPAGGGQMKGLRHHARQVVDVHHQVAVLGDRD